MTRFINLLGTDIWSEADILARGRALIAAQVSSVRQQELQTIMLGHMAQMRTATPEELAEIALVGQITQAQSAENDAARSDMALLLAVMAYEQAVKRLAQDIVVSEDTELVAQDITERNTAQALIDTAPLPVQPLYAERNPIPKE